MEREFYKCGRISGCVGAVDGTYIAIKAPSENAEVYINRKCFYGITLQAVCAYNREFLDTFVGYPSSVSDTRIFKHSDLYKDITANAANFLDENQFIIGDKAYPFCNWCIPSYIDRGNLNRYQKNFNKSHAETRQVIERVFALLFGRFRRLKYLDMNRIDLIPKTVQAACVLHNICLKYNDALLDDYDQEGRSAMCNQEHTEDEFDHNANQIAAEGSLLRDQIARNLEIIDD
ncbi:putative nuclease HARBI1 [Anoplophora glabripennis]|uniref:putative nuclease HARBI1 n=1 Tax=Anoplophora glabripennis TaxID=217634 RepID=UPI000C793120|nr:putative nuclease HARBI1 [Anoplophora glabripennis]